MFTYCGNDPILYSDKNGYTGELALVGGGCISAGFGTLFETFATSVASIAVPAAVPVALAIVAVGAIAWCGYQMYDAHQSNKRETTQTNKAFLDYASTAAPPPPPNKGGKGTRVTSKTLLNKGGRDGFRIDVENPGNRPGQIHLQKDGTKYIYNIAEHAFTTGTSNGPLAPSSIQVLLEDPDVITAIAKGLFILGY